MPLNHFQTDRHAHQRMRVNETAAGMMMKYFSEADEIDTGKMKAHIHVVK